jgi:hypothetical protein
MKAFALTSADKPATLVDLPDPGVPAGGVRIRVRATSVNGIDVYVANGYLVPMMEHRFPTVVGRDFAGVVDAVGEGRIDLAAGDEVFGFVPTTPPLETGTFAELVAGGPELVVARRPAGVSAEAAASIPLAGATALGSIDAAAIGAGDTVLVVGATGGVGSFVVQLAALRGATVIATAKAGDEDAFVRGLGAAETVDYTSGDVAQAIAGRFPDGIDAPGGPRQPRRGLHGHGRARARWRAHRHDPQRGRRRRPRDPWHPRDQRHGPADAREAGAPRRVGRGRHRPGRGAADLRARGRAGGARRVRVRHAGQARAHDRRGTRAMTTSELGAAAEPPAVVDRVELVAAALREHRIEAIVVGTADEARSVVLGLVPDGAEVHWGKSKTLDDIGVTAALLEPGRSDAIRPRMFALDRQTQGREIRKLMSAPDVMLGSVAAVTEDGTLVAASATGSQLGAYAAGAGRLVLVVGSQKIVPDLDAALRRTRDVVLPWENEQVRARMGVDTALLKVLVLYGEWPARRRQLTVTGAPLQHGRDGIDTSIGGAHRGRVPPA